MNDNVLFIINPKTKELDEAKKCLEENCPSQLITCGKIESPLNDLVGSPFKYAFLFGFSEDDFKRAQSEELEEAGIRIGLAKDYVVAEKIRDTPMIHRILAVMGYPGKVEPETLAYGWYQLGGSKYAESMLNINGGPSTGESIEDCVSRIASETAAYDSSFTPLPPLNNNELRDIVDRTQEVMEPVGAEW